MAGDIMFAPRRHRYAVLLALLLNSLAVQSFGVQSGAGGVLSDAFRTALGATMFLVVFEHPRERAAMAAILVATMAIARIHA